MGGECLSWKRCGGTQSEGNPTGQLGFCLNERQEYSMARIDIYLETNINIKGRPLTISAKTKRSPGRPPVNGYQMHMRCRRVIQTCVLAITCL